ncbi:sulfur carrier protein ThiS [Leminorella grimontii]|nr:sulfur carrier protein ThiS [Leminorella grimontii]KFC93239.1 hypothetical protein GLGR_3434 [Leminorella grimontii ATCC 33999 = DSM 5078]
MELQDSAALSDLLVQLGHPTQGIAIAVNQTIVPKTAWETHRLYHGDSVLMFQAIAGG